MTETPEAKALREKPDETIAEWDAAARAVLKFNKTPEFTLVFAHRLCAALAELKASKLCECPLMKKYGRLCEG